jgi:hypothetical protein
MLENEQKVGNNDVLYPYKYSYSLTERKVKKHESKVGQEYLKEKCDI